MHKAYYRGMSRKTWLGWQLLACLKRVDMRHKFANGKHLTNGGKSHRSRDLPHLHLASLPFRVHCTSKKERSPQGKPLRSKTDDFLLLLHASRGSGAMGGWLIKFKFLEIYRKSLCPLKRGDGEASYHHHRGMWEEGTWAVLGELAPGESSSLLSAVSWRSTPPPPPAVIQGVHTFSLLRSWSWEENQTVHSFSSVESWAKIVWRWRWWWW